MTGSVATGQRRRGCAAGSGVLLVLACGAGLGAQAPLSAEGDALEIQRRIWRHLGAERSSTEPWTAARLWALAAGLPELVPWPGRDEDPRLLAVESAHALALRAVRSARPRPPERVCDLCAGLGMVACPVCGGDGGGRSGQPRCPAAVPCRACAGAGRPGAEPARIAAMSSLAAAALEGSERPQWEEGVRRILAELQRVHRELPHATDAQAEFVRRSFGRVPFLPERLGTAARDRLRDAWRAADRFGRTSLLLRLGLVTASAVPPLDWLALGPAPEDAPTLDPGGLLALGLRGGGFARTRARLQAAAEDQGSGLVLRGVAELDLALLGLAAVDENGLQDLLLFRRMGLLPAAPNGIPEAARRAAARALAELPAGARVEVLGYAVPASEHPARVLVLVLEIRLFQEAGR
jgi:hypothetical protein